MSKGGNEDGFKLVFAFLAVLTIIAVWFIKWLTIVVVLVILAIVGIAKSCQKKKKIKTYETKTYKVENECDKQIMEYDRLFEKRIRQRGIEYYKQSQVGDIKENGREYSAIVYGKESYNIIITFNESKKIMSASCSCPYYIKNLKNCKHIYATLLKIREGKDMKENERKTEEEYKNYGLTEEEIKIAKEGIYSKEDFEEEEMDEDSYYYEDDTGEIDDSDEE